MQLETYRMSNNGEVTKYNYSKGTTVSVPAETENGEKIEVLTKDSFVVCAFGYIIVLCHYIRLLKYCKVNPKLLTLETMNRV